jgi:hypothetical protein
LTVAPCRAIVGRPAEALRHVVAGEVMPTYQMVYGDDEQVIRERYEDVDVQREDGWVVLFRGNDAILRVREEHVQSMDEV